MKCSIDNTVVVIPAYNEEVTISGVVDDFRTVFPKSKIVVIDNASTDNTSSIVSSKCNSDNNLILLYEPYKGKSNAVRRAFIEINSPYYLMVDADLTYPAKDALLLIEEMNSGTADMVVGDRVSSGLYSKENKRLFHDFGNSLVKFMLRKLFNSNSNDPLSGFRLFSNNFIKSYPIMVSGFELETDLTIWCVVNRFRLKEVSINYKDRPEGSQSKLNTYKDGAKLIILMISMYGKYKPLTLFGGIAFIIFLVSATTGVVVIKEFIDTGFVHRMPTAILSVGMALFALMVLIIGILFSIRNSLERKIQEIAILNTK